ncbi:transposase [Catenulispora sp. NL8]|uniref:Transposase n=1 Tax=Catenulispora pinistramenti TaxID=2705254 RepID=A0ABS5KLP1_9ACTN|nr:transposase [Catenulispora pinistramenti]
MGRGDLTDEVRLRLFPRWLHLQDPSECRRPGCRWLRRRGIRHTIPEKSDSQAARLRKGSRGGRPPGFDKQCYGKRNSIEQAINKLKQFRAGATRYDKRSYVFLGTVHRHHGGPRHWAPYMIDRTSSTGHPSFCRTASVRRRRGRGSCLTSASRCGRRHRASLHPGS